MNILRFAEYPSRVSPRTTPGPLLVGLISLSTYRLTKLVTLDEIARPLRERIWNRWPPDAERAGLRWTGQHHVIRAADAKKPAVSLLGRLVRCPNCVSVWAAAFVTGLTVLYVSVPLPMLVLGAATALACLLSTLDRWASRGAT